MAASKTPLPSNQQPQEKCYKTRGKKETMCITKTCNLVTVICYPHLISREELCNRLHFPIPSSFLDCNNNDASNGAARRTPEAANFQKKRSLRAGGREGREFELRTASNLEETTW
jgi:hypothetical protein